MGSGGGEGVENALGRIGGMGMLFSFESWQSTMETSGEKRGS